MPYSSSTPWAISRASALRADLYPSSQTTTISGTNDGHALAVSLVDVDVALGIDGRFNHVVVTVRAGERQWFQIEGNPWEHILH